MAAKKQPSPRRPLTVPITVAGVLACVGLCLFGFPGMVAIWFAALLVSITHPPAVLTGPRVGGVVTAAHEGEEARVRKHREVSSRKGGLVTLSDLWSPCAPFGKGEYESRFPQWSWATAVLAGLAAGLTLPARNLDGGPNVLFALVNGVAVASVIATYAAARRRFMTVTPDGSPDPCPGVRVDALVRYGLPKIGPEKGHPVVVLAAVLLAGTAAWFTAGFALGLMGGLFDQAAATGKPVLDRFSAPDSDAMGRLPLAVALWWGSVTALLWSRPLLVLPGAGLRDFAIGPWLLRMEAREEWAPRFDTLKLTGTQVTGRTKVGPATVDTFRPATGKTVADYLKAAVQLPTHLGDGLSVTVLQIPSEQMPGQFHPSEFEIVTWPADAPFDFNTTPESSGDPERDHALLTLATRVALAKYADSAQAPRVILDDISPVSHASEPEPDAEVEPHEVQPIPTAQPRPPVREQSRPAALTRPTPDHAVTRPPAPGRFDPHDPNTVADAIFSDPSSVGYQTFESHAVRTIPLDDPFLYAASEGDTAPGSRGRLKRAAASFSGSVARGSRKAVTLTSKGLSKVGPAFAHAARGLASTLGRGKDDAPAHGDAQAEGSPVVYRVLVQGGNYPMMKVAHLGPLADGFASEALVDDGRLSQQAPALYVGALADRSVEFAPESGVTQMMLENIRQEAWWTPKWAQSLKTSVKPPDWHFAGHLEARLADGTVIKRDGFQVKQGDHPEKFFDAEAGVRTALSNAAFCSITAWPGVRGTRPGERDPGTLALWYADQGAQIPMTPDLVVPPSSPAQASMGRPGQQRRRRVDYTAEQAVLAWLTNQAFENQRLKRPEVVSVEPLTAPNSPRHIWKVRVRFHGGVTLADVRAKADNIRSAFGTPWLRVMPADDGCVLVAGCQPQDAALVDGDRTQAFLESLDLEQAFLDAGVRGKGGLTPTLIEQSVMPRNPDVRVLDYRLPAGVDLNQVRASISRLRTNTNMDFMSAFPGKHGAASIRVLMAREDPMPFPVGFDWEYDHSTGRIAFGTGVDGEYAVWDIKETPHMALVGGSGYGKSVSAQVFITGLLLYGAHVAVGDAQKFCADFQFAEPWTMVQAKSVADVRAMLEAMYAESKRRARLNGQHGVGNVKDLPEHLRPRTWVVLLDEFEGLIESAGRPSTKQEPDPEMEQARLELMAEYENKGRIAYLAGRIFAESRSADVHIIVMTQKLKADKLPPALSSLKTNAGRAIVGKTTWGDRASALRDPENAPDIGEEVPKGRGIWESMEAPAVACQWWYASQEELAQGLRHAEVQPAPRLDLGEHLPAAPGAREKFAVIGDDPSPAVDGSVNTDPDDWAAVPLVSGDPFEAIGEVVDLGDFSLDAGEEIDLGTDLGEMSMDDLPDATPVEPLEDFEITFDPGVDRESTSTAVGWLGALAAAADRLPAHVEPEPERESLGEPRASADTAGAPQASPPPARPPRPRRKAPRVVPLPAFEDDDEPEFEEVSLGVLLNQPQQPVPEPPSTVEEPFGPVASPSRYEGPF